MNEVRLDEELSVPCRRRELSASVNDLAGDDESKVVSLGLVD